MKISRYMLNILKYMHTKNQVKISCLRASNTQITEASPAEFFYCSSLGNQFNCPTKRIYFIMKFYHMINIIYKCFCTQNEIKMIELRVWNHCKTEPALHLKNKILQQLNILNLYFSCLINTHKFNTLKLVIYITIIYSIHIIYLNQFHHTWNQGFNYKHKYKSHAYAWFLKNKENCFLITLFYLKHGWILDEFSMTFFPSLQISSFNLQKNKIIKVYKG